MVKKERFLSIYYILVLILEVVIFDWYLLNMFNELYLIIRIGF